MIKSSFNSGTLDGIESYTMANTNQFYNEIDDCFGMVDNPEKRSDGIDGIYLLVNAISIDNELTESTLDRLFKYYIENFSNLLSSANWHFFNISLDLFGTKIDVFKRNEKLIDLFVDNSMLLLAFPSLGVGTDFDIAIDYFLTMIFNVEDLDKYKTKLLQYADDHPENPYAEDIYEAAR
ncbi:hypothetical protein [Taibaiella chishuiensis]|nr:hypothetical protein [Taibaiella chishuiensis]